MSQIGQTHFKNLAALSARFLKGVWPFWDIMHYRVKMRNQSIIHCYTFKHLGVKCEKYYHILVKENAS